MVSRCLWRGCEACAEVATAWRRRYSEKPLLRREISNGLYHYSSFFIAKGLVSLPFQLMFACIFTGSVYFLVRSSTLNHTGPWLGTSLHI